VSKEAAKMIELNHPNIMPLLSIFFEQIESISSVCLEMPYCDGGSIVDYVINVRPGLAHGRVILLQVVDALAHMHTKKVVHGDLKPANILMTTNGLMTSQPKVADFGLSRDGGTTLSSFSGSGGGGTQGFMAPDLLNGSHAVPTIASDMWAFGKVLQHVKGALSDMYRQESTEQGLDDLAQKLMAENPIDRPLSDYVKAHRFFVLVQAPETERECLRCGDVGIESDGLACAADHYVCNGCFDDQLTSLMGLTRENPRPIIENLQRARGEIHCLLPTCACGAFPLSVVAKHVKGDTFEALLKCQEETLRIDLKAQRCC
jgi:serine/threonine protein kinase